MNHLLEKMLAHLGSEQSVIANPVSMGGGGGFWQSILILGERGTVLYWRG